MGCFNYPQTGHVLVTSLRGKKKQLENAIAMVKVTFSSAIETEITRLKTTWTSQSYRRYCQLANSVNESIMIQRRRAKKMSRFAAVRNFKSGSQRSLMYQKQ